jgi:hypothetical protein
MVVTDLLEVLESFFVVDIGPYLLMNASLAFALGV